MGGTKVQLPISMFVVDGSRILNPTVEMTECFLTMFHVLFVVELPNLQVVLYIVASQNGEQLGTIHMFHLFVPRPSLPNGQSARNFSGSNRVRHAFFSFG